jgi:hypothetical protein
MDPYILTEIFEYLDLISKCTVRCVCHSWRVLIHLPESLIMFERCGIAEVVDWNQFTMSSVNDKLSVGCCLGDIPLILKMINCGADDWNGGLRGACSEGHHDIVNMMIDRGADDWDGGLCHARMSGHHDIIMMMIKYGAIHCIVCQRSIKSGQAYF